MIQVKFILEFLASDFYLIINDIDIRIVLLDFTNGNYISIFEKSNEQFERLYNIIDTYDEGFSKIIKLL